MAAGDPVFGFWVSESRDVVVSANEYGGENYHRLGEGTISVLSDAIAWYEAVTDNDSAAPDDEDDSWHWTEAMNAYAGGVMVRMLEEAKERGCFSFVTWDFSRTADSNGDPWTSDTAITDLRIPVGTDLLSVVGMLRQLGLTFVMDTDFVLHAYESSGYGTDVSATVSFERTVNLAETVEHDVIASPARSTVLVKGTRGDNGATAWIEADSAAGLAEVKRRKEGFIDAGSTTGTASLTTIGLDDIYQKLRLRRGPAALPVVDGTLAPFVDYSPGDTVNVYVNGTWNNEHLRLTGIQISDRETGDYDVLAIFDAGPSYQSKAGSTPPPQTINQAGDSPDNALSSRGATAYAGTGSGGTPTLVQSVAAGTSGSDGGGQTASLGAAPTSGNILIAIVGNRDATWAIAPSGYTELVANAYDGVDSRRLQILAKVSDGTDGTISFSNAGNAWPESIVFSEWSGFGGVLPSVDTSATSDVANDDTPAVPAITPTASITALLVAAVWKSPAGPNPGPATLSGYTTIDDSGYAGTGNRHRLTAWYQVANPTSGTYGPTSTSSSGDASDDSNIIHAALKTGTAWTTPAPNVNDGDDATYHAITGTDLLRVTLAAAKKTVYARVRIASATAGSRTLTIKAATLSDYSDIVTLGTVTFTAIGSNTAQDVVATWTNTTAYRYYQLSIGTSDTYRVHTWELRESSVVTDLAAHTGDTSDAHDASAISIVDAGGYYTGTDVEAALQEVGAGTLSGFVTTTGGGKEVYQSHGAMGATETIDLANGNYHYGTLDANCTFTFTGSTAGKLCSFVLELTENGTGGFSPTWPGSVVWIGDTPTHDTTASTTTFYVFHTHDNGTTWYGAQVGSGGGGTPATTVESETTFGLSAAVGTDTEYARQDHTHGSPSEATVRDLGHWEVVVSGTAPPVAVSNPDDDDWVYAWVSG